MDIISIKPTNRYFSKREFRPQEAYRIFNTWMGGKLFHRPLQNNLVPNMYFYRSIENDTA